MTIDDLYRSEAGAGPIASLLNVSTLAAMMTNTAANVSGTAAATGQ